jgi:hypothetical protein
MKKTLVSALLVVLSTFYTQAQTKIFKEVDDAISSQVKIIRQDNALVGYLVFTQLEKASEDSFNYKITIMDENLNDIGTVNFRERGLVLQDVSFDQDVLCLGYVKSNFIGNKFNSKKEYKAALNNSKDEVFTQFISLEGKILKTNSFNASLKISSDASDFYYNWGKPVKGYGGLVHDIQIKNISQKGFSVFYGDKVKNNLLVFNTKGELLWQKKINTVANEFYMLTSSRDIYLLSKKDYVTGQTAVLGGYASVNNEGDYELTGYHTGDTTSETHFTVKDGQGNQLKVLAFNNDAVTGKPYLSGCIIDPKKAGNYVSGRAVAKGPYLGVFTINVNGSKPDEIKKVFTYWADGSTEGVSNKSLFTETGSYANFTSSFKDFNGNTYFTGSEMIKRTKWGSIASSVILSPLIIVSPCILAFVGTSKCKLTDAILVKQNEKGVLSVENSIPAEHSRFFRPIAPVPVFDTKNYYTVFNADTKTNYLIVDDTKNISIYNVNQKKVQRTIAHKDGDIKTNVFPAKEGYVMVAEYNKKEKYTKFSIEAL